MMGFFSRKWKKATKQSPPPPLSSPAAASKLNVRPRKNQVGTTFTQPIASSSTKIGLPSAIQTTQTLWEKAYDDLKIKDDTLVDAYERIISRELKWGLSGADTLYSGNQGELPDQAVDMPNKINQTSPRGRKDQMNRIIAQGLKRMDDRKIKYQIAGNEFVLQDQVDQTVRFVLSAKDFVGQAVQNCPQASLAWAGACLLLPIFTNPSTAEKANIDGIAYVTSKMRWYCVLEELLLPQNVKPSTYDLSFKNLREEFERHLLVLYSLLLEFQMKSACRYYRSRVGNLGRDMANFDDWKQMVLTIQDQEMTIENEAQQINTERSLSELKGIYEKSEAVLGYFKSLLSLMQEQLTIAKEHRDVSVQHFEVSKRIEQREISHDEQKCLQVFSGTDYKWYKDRIESRIEGTCQWFLTQANYRDWLKQSSGPLLVSADPGCGKSVLAKYLIDHELPRSATICYFFFKDQDQNNAKQALCALLHQLLSRKHALIQHARQAVSSCGENLPKLFSELWSILITAAADPEAGEIICVLDALDECEQSEMETLTGALAQYYSSSSSRSSELKFLLTSRPYDDIVTAFQRLVHDHPYIRIPGEDSSEIISTEVNAVIRKKVETLAKEKSLSPSLAECLEQLLLEVTHRTYLWVYLVFDFLKTHRFKKTRTGIQDAIKTLPHSIEDAYEEILQRPSAVDKSKSRKILSMIIAANRPFTLMEMNIALEVSPSCKSAGDLDLEAESDFREAIRQCCGLFVSIHQNRVYLIHQTAREFLLDNLNRPEARPEEVNGIVARPQTAKEFPLQDEKITPTFPIAKRPWKHSISLKEGHRVLAESCVIYLSFDDFNTGFCLTDEDLETRLQTNPFYLYASRNWGYHVHLALTEIEPLTLSFLASEAKVSASIQVIIATSEYQRGEKSKRNVVTLQRTTGVQIAAYFSLWNTMEALLKNGQYSDLKDNFCRTPLSRTAEKGQESMAKLLLEKGANVDIKDNGGWTPLLWAAKHGHDAVVKLLLDYDAELDSTDDDFGWTPLIWAIRNRHDIVIKLLLEKGAKPNFKDSRGWTPLLWAAQFGYCLALNLLLEKGAEIDTQDIYGWTALRWATWSSEHEAMRLLLEKGANAIDATAEPTLSKQKLKFIDAVGRKFAFPFKLVAKWPGMQKLILECFINVQVIGPHVSRGYYDLLGPSGEIIIPQAWEALIEEGWTITMHMWPFPNGQQEKLDDPDEA